MTLLELKTQLYDDLNRADMTAQVANAISSAIKHYEKERWWFLEGTTATATVANQEYCNLPSNVLFPDSIIITISGSKEPLDRVSYEEINRKDSGSITGYPSEWAYYKDQIRFYPVPDDVYTLTYSYVLSLADLSDGASNSWTTEAKDLVRFRTLREIYGIVIKDAENAQIAGMGEVEIYNGLQRLNNAKLTMGKIVKTDW